LGRVAEIGPEVESYLGRLPANWLQLQVGAIGINLLGLPSVVQGSLLVKSLLEGIQSLNLAIPNLLEDLAKAFKVPSYARRSPVKFAPMASYSSKASSSIAEVRFGHLKLGDTSLTYVQRADSCFTLEVVQPSSDATADTILRCFASSVDSPGTTAATTAIDHHTDGYIPPSLAWLSGSYFGAGPSQVHCLH
jgi:hypothetical protein